MSGDPLASPHGSQHGDQPQQGTLPGFSNVYSGYQPFTQQRVASPVNTQGEGQQPASGSTLPGIYMNAYGSTASVQDASVMVASVKQQGPIKVQSNEIWSGEANALHDFTFSWAITLQSHNLRMASDMLSDPDRGHMLINLASQTAPDSQFVQSIFRENAALFAFVMERISTSTTRGKNLRADIADTHRGRSSHTAGEALYEVWRAH